MSRTIIITGATGNQGSAVLDSMINNNDVDFKLLALTRNTNSPAAQRLAAKSKSVQLLQGDMNNPNQIFTDAERMTGKTVWGVFMVQNVLTGGVTPAQEEAQGKAFIDSCVKNSVRMLIYSSVDRGGSIRSAQDPTPVAAFASKHRIEKHLVAAARSSEMRWFVLRPTGLLEPLLRNDMVGKLGRTSWKALVSPDRSVQWVSCKDIGHFAAQGFVQPEKWSGQYLSLAGWVGTFEQADQASRKVRGKPLSLTFQLLARVACGMIIKDLGLMYKWLDGDGFGADIVELRRRHSGLRSLEDFLAEQAS